MNSPGKISFESVDLADLDKLASLMVRWLPDSLVLGLVGTLGVGKTTFVQAISRVVGVDTADVTSPTFTLLQSHRGSITLHHLDAYRVADEDEFLELGVEELFEQTSAWTLVEWADRVAEVMPVDTLWVEITIDADRDRRSFHFTAGNHQTTEGLKAIRTAF